MTALPHSDHIEMSGQQVSVVYRYGVNDKGGFELNRSVVWPLDRTIPDNTHAATIRRFTTDYAKEIMIKGRPFYNEHVDRISLDGIMTVESTLDVCSADRGFGLVRQIFPSATAPSVIEIYTLTNNTDKPYEIMMPSGTRSWVTEGEKGVDGPYTITATLTADKPVVILQPGESATLSLDITCESRVHADKPVSAEAELAQRQQMVKDITKNLVLRTPNDTINQAFRMAKIRACESIALTEAGPMHSPGGESYYAAIWANDQAEYANPFFAYAGYPLASESAMTSWRLFAGYMDDEYTPIPSSIVSEGRGIWNGAGDRGDAAMIAYGAGRYALASGDKEIAKQLMPLIEWCLEYCQRKLTADGVVASDCDELERRFPAGDANLCTSSLYYDALISASHLSRDLGTGRQKEYASRAKELRKNLVNHFSANVEGFDTYKYYDGNDILRSWICIPMVMGIDDRNAGTVEALLSPRLMTQDGLLTAAGSETFWDRTTLYALRGMYNAGAVKEATDFLTQYSATRLLGDHVPYPIEAWPEGDQRHLSAESALYCRIFTEGMIGLRPTGIDRIEICPNLPEEWDEVSLQRICAGSATPYDLAIKRTGKKYTATLTTADGRTLTRTAPSGSPISFKIP